MTPEDLRYPHVPEIVVAFVSSKSSLVSVAMPLAAVPPTVGALAQLPIHIVLPSAEKLMSSVLPPVKPVPTAYQVSSV